MPDFPLIDSDGHVIEHTLQIIECMDPPYNDPHGYRTQAFGLFPPLDGFPRVGGLSTPGRRDVPDVSGWSKFLEESGLAHAVLFPTAGLAYGLLQDTRYQVVLGRAYNTWLHRQYTSREPRLHGMALIPVLDPVEAARELRRAVTELGFAGAMLPAITATGRGYGNAFFDPIYKEAEQLGCPLAFHGGPSRGLGFDFFDKFIQAHTLEHPFSQMIQLTSVVFDGVFDRFPRLKLVFLEAGCGWMPYMMDRLDEEFERRGKRWCPDMQRKPSEYFTSGNIYVTLEVEEAAVPFVIERMGAQHVLFASDYPHERSHGEYMGDLPELLGREDISDEAKRKILYENPKRLYQLDV
jgi:predicted TIM-barrel fold metal-dependent hydrolase